MGKHDREIQMDWNEDAGESYTAAENLKLRAENERLKTVIKELEREAVRMEKVYGDVVKAAKKVVAEKDAEIANLKAAVVKWKGKALGLVDEYVQVS